MEMLSSLEVTSTSSVLSSLNLSMLAVDQALTSLVCSVHRVLYVVCTYTHALL